MQAFTRKIFFSVCLSLAVMSSSGCFPLLVGAAAGVGGYAWVNGELVKEYPTTAEKLRQAATKGIKNLDLAVEEDQGDRLTSRIVARFSDGKKAEVRVEAVTEKTAKLKIRVGLFGDQVRSEMILTAIEKNI